MRISDNRRPNYIIEADTPDQLIIRDVGPWEQHLSVTNGAEYVVEELADRLKGRTLLYYDSENQLDELVVKDGQFAGFAPGPRP